MPKPAPYSKLSTLAGYRVMQQDGPLLRLRSDQTGKECVVEMANKIGTRVVSVGKDSPDRGRWCGAATPQGIAYVATWNSPTTARRRFKAEVAT